MLNRTTASIIALTMMATISTGGEAKDKKERASALKGQLILYKGKNYDGESYLIDQSQTTVELQWNIGSIGVGPDTKFEICAKRRFQAPCITLAESVPDASAIGIYGGIGSAHPVP